MRLLTILCLVLLSVHSYSQEIIPEDRAEELTEIIFLEGSNEYESEAIAFALYDTIYNALKYWLQESHFIYGASCNSNEECRQNLNFDLGFKTASVDLNLDGSNEVIVTLIGPNMCGSGGCTSYILEKDKEVWRLIGTFFPGGEAKTSSNKNDGYFDVYYSGRSNTYSCIYNRDESRYEC